MVTDAEHIVLKAAREFARSNKKAIAKRVANPAIYLSEENPVSVFMAGSPGAGKTEASKALIETISDGQPILRIDPDELRSEFPDYDGTNSSLFQGAVSIITDKIHDIALKQSQSFVLDGTFSSLDKCRENVQRSLKKGRFVQILYVYQQPELAWRFVMAREAVEGRSIPVDRFIDQYFAAREVVNSLKQEFKDKIRVELLLKDNDGTNKTFRANVDRIDNHIPEKYTKAQIETLISEISQ